MDFSNNYYFKPHLVDENLEWCAVAHLGERRKVTNGCDFIPNDCDLIFIKSGYMRFYCDTDIKKNNFTLIIGRNSLANAGGAITGANRFSRFRTEKEAEIVVFNADLFLKNEYVQAHPLLYIGMAKTLAKTLGILASRTHNTCFHSCLPRMCQTILAVTDPQRTNNMQYVRAITQNDLAQLAGMHPVTASKVLKELRAGGILGKIRPFCLEIFDYQALKDISESKFLL